MIQRSTTTREPPFYIESDGQTDGRNAAAHRQHDLSAGAAPRVVRVRPDGVRRRQHVRPLRARQPQPPRLAGRVRGPAASQRTCGRGAATTASGRKARRPISSSSSRRNRRAKRTRPRSARSTRTSCGVSEYFLFDPFEEYLHPRLQGYRLASGRVPADPAVEGPAAEQGAGSAPGGRRRPAAAVRPGGPADGCRFRRKCWRRKRGRKRREGKRKRLGESGRPPAGGRSRGRALRRELEQVPHAGCRVIPDVPAADVAAYRRVPRGGHD